MTTAALLMMLGTCITVSAITGFFFWKVLTTPHKATEEHLPEDKFFDLSK
jgi:hypothetical protein